MTDDGEPDALVDPTWVADRLGDPSVRLIEVGSLESYAAGHLPGAIHWDWERDILASFRLRPIAAATMGALLSRSGIRHDTTIVLTGDWPTLSLWLLDLFGHTDARILEGGQDRWVAEGRPLVTVDEEVTPTVYPIAAPNWTIRANHDEVLARLGQAGSTLLDVRTSEEYHGEDLWPGAPPGYCQRAGHIPGARHLAWDQTMTADGRFQPVAGLRALFADAGILPEHEIIPYCTIGGRSSHVWFVLARLLDYPRVRLYDGSWLEWSHLVDAPIARETDGT